MIMSFFLKKRGGGQVQDEVGSQEWRNSRDEKRNPLEKGRGRDQCRDDQRHRKVREKGSAGNILRLRNEKGCHKVQAGKKDC